MIKEDQELLDRFLLSLKRFKEESFEEFSGDLTKLPGTRTKKLITAFLGCLEMSFEVFDEETSDEKLDQVLAHLFMRKLLTTTQVGGENHDTSISGSGNVSD